MGSGDPLPMPEHVPPPVGCKESFLVADGPGPLGRSTTHTSGSTGRSSLTPRSIRRGSPVEAPAPGTAPARGGCPADTRSRTWTASKARSFGSPEARAARARQISTRSEPTRSRWPCCGAAARQRRPEASGRAPAPAEGKGGRVTSDRSLLLAGRGPFRGPLGSDTDRGQAISRRPQALDDSGQGLHRLAAVPPAVVELDDGPRGRLRQDSPHDG